MVVKNLILSGKWSREWDVIHRRGFHMSQSREIRKHGGTRFTELDHIIGEWESKLRVGEGELEVGATCAVQNPNVS